MDQQESSQGKIKEVGRLIEIHSSSMSVHEAEEESPKLKKSKAIQNQLLIQNKVDETAKVLQETSASPKRHFNDM